MEEELNDEACASLIDDAQSELIDAEMSTEDGNHAEALALVSEVQAKLTRITDYLKGKVDNG